MAKALTGKCLARDAKLYLLPVLLLLMAAPAQGADELSYWNDGKAKQSIVAFVGRVTTQGGGGLRPGSRTHRRLRQ